MSVRSTLISLCTIASLGYLLGSIRLAGITLGTAGIFIVGLAFGHFFGTEMPAALQTLGLVMIMTSIGLGSGKGFLQRISRNGPKYLTLALTTSIVGALTVRMLMRLTGMEGAFAAGIMSGAFTSSAAFGAAKEAAATPEAAVLTAAGYGIAYPVGVSIKVLFIQMIPKLFHLDMEKEISHLSPPGTAGEGREEKQNVPLFKVDGGGFFSFMLASLCGILLGSLKLPLPGGMSFSLGNSGGPLMAGLLFSGLGQLGPLDLSVKKETSSVLKELGLLLFFSCAGCEGGRGLSEALSDYGAASLFYALCIVIVPLLSGTWMFRKILKLHWLNGLSSLTASMTCTPSLAMLAKTAGTDRVVTEYAATYPIAVIIILFTVRLIAVS